MTKFSVLRENTKLLAKLTLSLSVMAFNMMKLMVKTFITTCSELMYLTKQTLPFCCNFLYSKYDVRYSIFDRAFFN